MGRYRCIRTAPYHPHDDDDDDDSYGERLTTPGTEQNDLRTMRMTYMMTTPSIAKDVGLLFIVCR